MIKAIVFDLDDTLISEYDYIKSGFKHIANLISTDYKLEASKIYEKILELFYETPKNVFDRVLEYYNIPYKNEDILSFVKLYREHKPSIKYYDDVVSFIKQLKEKKLKIGIITDGYIETQRAKLNVLKAYDLFDNIIITEELGREYWKPHPKAYEMMKETFGIEYDEMMYIGDNPEKDFYIGHIYPVKTVRIIRENSI